MHCYSKWQIRSITDNFDYSLAINLSFKFNGVDFPVSDIDFNVGPAPSTNGNALCTGAAAYFEGSDLWILGDVFRKSTRGKFSFYHDID